MDRLTTRNKFGQAEIGFYDMETKGIKKLAYYEDLEEQGRLVKLPCAKGDTVFFIRRGEIKKDTINSISLDIYDSELRIWLGANDKILFKLNQTVFLTREEAEAKLKEMESNDRDS